MIITAKVANSAKHPGTFEDVVPMATVVKALLHVDPALRIDALVLVCTCTKKLADRIPPATLDLIVLSLSHNMTLQSAGE
jgi:hypothetical protein